MALQKFSETFSHGQHLSRCPRYSGGMMNTNRMELSLIARKMRATAAQKQRRQQRAGADPVGWTPWGRCLARQNRELMPLDVCMKA
jgi:hypothetical protein